MTHPVNHRILRQLSMGLAVMLLTLAMSICARAAISGGPVYTNGVVAAQNHNAQFYEAEHSNQEKLKVGRERYNQKQIIRAGIIASMSAQLQARQETVVIHPMSVHDGLANEPDSRSLSSLAAGVLVVGLIAGCGYFLNRSKPKFRAPPKRREICAVEGSRSVRGRYRITALKPVTVWANVEVSKMERTPLGAKVSQTRDEPAWVRLKAGEVRDKLGLVVGIHPNCVPNGKRVYMTGADADIVPLGSWTDGDLPKNFFEYFKLEASE